MSEMKYQVRNVMRDIGGKKIKTVKLPSKVVLAKKFEHGGTRDWKAKARTCACGNYEEGVGGDIHNRSEVLSTFEMRAMLALG